MQQELIYSESQLIRFGNFLFLTYGVMVHSSDGKNQPIYERMVTDADLCNWKELENSDATLCGKREFTFGDSVKVFLMPEGESDFPGFNAKIISVHQLVGKCKYDVEITFAGGFKSRIYNVDEVLVARA